LSPADNNSPFRCDACDAAIPGAGTDRGEAFACPTCGAPLRIQVFPALFRKFEPGQAPEAVAMDDESSCFYHPSKRAVHPCDHCGRFLCALCEIEMGGRRLCSTCLEQGARGDRQEVAKREYVYYDSIALLLAVLPVIFIWPTLFTAPMAIYFAIRYWRRPLSVLPRNRWRFVVAALIAVAQIAMWAMLAASVATNTLV